MNRQSISLLLVKILSHLVGLLPFVWLVYVINFQLLSADPAKDIQHFTGLMALRLLVLNAFVPVLVYYFKMNSLFQTRKILGLWCFAWATLHVMSYLLLEIGWNNANLFFVEIFSRFFLLIGLICWSGLAIMAISSNEWVHVKLGIWWKRIHKLFYPVLVLVIIHYILSTKVLTPEPFIYLVLIIFTYSQRFWKK